MRQDAWRAYLEVALGATEASGKKAVKAVRKLVGKGGLTAKQLETLAEELVRAGAANREMVAGVVRSEVDRALAALGLAKADEVATLAARVRDLEAGLGTARKTPAPAAVEATAAVEAQAEIEATAVAAEAARRARTDARPEPAPVVEAPAASVPESAAAAAEPAAAGPVAAGPAKVAKKTVAKKAAKQAGPKVGEPLAGPMSPPVKKVAKKAAKTTTRRGPATGEPAP